MLVSPVVLPLAAHDSSVRTLVVPTASTRPPRWRQRSRAARVDSGMSYHSLCIWCWLKSSVFTG